MTSFRGIKTAVCFIWSTAYDNQNIFFLRLHLFVSPSLKVCSGKSLETAAFTWMQLNSVQTVIFNSRIVYLKNIHLKCVNSWIWFSEGMKKTNMTRWRSGRVGDRGLGMTELPSITSFLNMAKFFASKVELNLFPYKTLCVYLAVELIDATVN